MAKGRKAGASALEKARIDLLSRLPAFMGTAIDAYAAMAATPLPPDAKEAAQHHSACKAALAHLDLLTRLARSLDMEKGPGGGDDGGAGDDLQAMIASARSALLELDEEED